MQVLPKVGSSSGVRLYVSGTLHDPYSETKTPVFAPNLLSFEALHSLLLAAGKAGLSASSVLGASGAVNSSRACLLSRLW